MIPAPADRERPTPSPTARPRRQLASVTLAIALATTGVLPVFLTGALAVQLEAHLHVGATAIGGAVATYFCASALSSVRAGRLAERIGPFRVLLAAIALAITALFGIGLLVTALPVLLAFLFVGGLSNGAIQPAVNLLLARAVDEHRRGLAFGIKQAAIPTATLLSGLAVPALALTTGWQSAYLVAGGLALVVATALVTGGRRLMPARDRGSSPAGGRTDRETPPFDLRPLVFLAVAMACAVAAANALGSFVVPGAVHDGIAPGLAGLLSAAGSAVGLSTRVGLGWRADRSSHRGPWAADEHLKTVTLLIAIGVLGYAGLATGELGLLVPGVLLAYGGGWGYNGLFNLAVVRAYAHAPARATGITQVGTYLGGMVGPLGFGVVVDHLGYHVGWMLCAALAVLAIVGFLVSRRRLHTALTTTSDVTESPATAGASAPSQPTLTRSAGTAV